MTWTIAIVTLFVGMFIPIIGGGIWGFWMFYGICYLISPDYALIAGIVGAVLGVFNDMGKYQGL